MSEVCEIVTIETENGKVDINKSDYDPKIHTLAGEKKDKEPAKVKKSK